MDWTEIAGQISTPLVPELGGLPSYLILSLRERGIEQVAVAKSIVYKFINLQAFPLGILVGPRTNPMCRRSHIKEHNRTELRYTLLPP